MKQTCCPENVSSIVEMAKALEIACSEIDAKNTKLTKYCINCLPIIKRKNYKAYL